MDGSKKNDVWVYRTKPPKDFNKELDAIPSRSDSAYSPFEIYDEIKEKRRKRKPKEVKQEMLDENIL